jgi:excisionase family DNA binding protein
VKRPADPNVLSADEVAARIGIGRRQVYEAAARGAIPHQRVGQRILFYWPAVVAWLSGTDEAKAASG